MIDDLEIEIVAALEAQHQLDKGNGTTALDCDANNMPGGNAIGNGCNSPDNLRRKQDQKKRWKTWGWKYSPGGKTSSIEEEPESPKHSVTSKTNSPKHSSTILKSDAVTNVSPYESPNHKSRIVENRSSAGARLCQMFDGSFDETDDELQALIVNGRPASVHVLPSNSDKPLMAHDI